MNDPYLYEVDNDLSNIQVNVYRVRGSLRNKSISESDKFLHKEGTIFNPKDVKQKWNEKIIQEKIYLSDTIEIVLNKIAIHCCEGEKNSTGKDIFAWIDHNTKVKPTLRYSYPLGVRYEDLESYMNPFIDKDYDNRFSNIDGSIKRNSKYSLDYYSSYGSQYDNLIDEDILTIYFCSAQDILNYASSEDSGKLNNLNNDILINGYLKKYIPLYGDNDKNYQKNIMNKIQFINDQKRIVHQNDQEGIMGNLEYYPNFLLYKNKVLSNSVDTYKIFNEFILTNEVPYIRIQLDSYLDSSIKFKKTIIKNNLNYSDKETLTKDIFEKWHKKLITPNAFVPPHAINLANSLTFVIYDKKTRDYAMMILYSTASVEIYCDRKFGMYTNKQISKFIEISNRNIRIINKNELSHTNIRIPEIKDINPSRIDVSYMYDIPDYNPKILLKPFRFFSGEFLILEEDDTKPIHLLYCRSSNFENPKSSLDFVTLLKKRAIPDDKIINLLVFKYNISEEKADELIKDWGRLNLNQNMKINRDDNYVSIIIEKILDRIKVSFMGLSGFYELHEIVKPIHFIMNIYKEKKVNKNKSLPKDILQLFKKVSPKRFGTKIELEESPIPKEPEESPIPKEPEEPEEPEGSEQTDIQLGELHEGYMDKDEQKEQVDESEDESEGSEEESEGSEDESEDEYERIDSSDSSQSGGGNFDKRAGVGKNDTDDESTYPNKRYFIKRLEQRDPKLIKYKGKTPQEAYAKKCPATQDKQPIVVTKKDLKEIDEKTGFKNEGVSYTKAYRVEGGGRDKSEELYYICPKYWDRKHQIPLDPQSKYHPIEVDEEGKKTIEYRNFVWSREMKANDCYILERTGRPANRQDSDSYWNRDPESKYNILNYNVQFIQDDVHPELLSLPCCGKKEIKLGNKVLILKNDKGDKPHWVEGEIVGELNDKDEYPIKQLLSNGKKIIKNYHISLLKENKGRSGYNRLLSDSEFPLNKGSAGHINPLLKDLFNTPNDSPFISSINKKSRTGLYRVGISQNSDSFLHCIDTIHCINKDNPNVKRHNPDLKMLKEHILSDMKKKEFDIFKIGGGSFVQYFRSESLEATTDSLQEIQKNVYENFEKYLYSKETKDERLLIPLLMEISKLTKNETFEGNQINIIVFQYETKNKLSIVEPFGSLKIHPNVNYSFIYKSEDKYEPIIYYDKKNIKSGYFFHEKDNSKIAVGDYIVLDGGDQEDTIAEVLKVKKDKLHIKKDTDEKAGEIDNNKEIRKYDKEYLIDLFQNFIIKKQSVIRDKSKEIITEEDLHFVMDELNYEPLNKGYYDTYNKLSFVDYKEKKKKGFKRLTLPIRPKSLSEESFQERIHFCDKLPKLSLSYIVSYLLRIDKKITERFEGKYLSYSHNLKVIVDPNEKMLGLLLSCGLILPLEYKKYNFKKYKIDSINSPSLLDLQNHYLMGTKEEDKDITEYFEEYNKKNEYLYENFSKIYNEIKKSKILSNDVNKIINHPIKLLIHKRYDLLELFSKNKDIQLEKKDLKQFIEYLLIHGIEGINKKIIHKFISFQNLQIRNSSEEIVIFTMKDIINETYENLFRSRSNFRRNNISMYNEYNPDIPRKLLKKQLEEKHVSFYTKYPNLLNRLFIGNTKVLKNIVSEELNDIQIVSDILLNIKPEITSVIIKQYLLDEFTTNEKSYLYQNILLREAYKTNNDLLSELEDPNYNLTSYDLKILSFVLNVGFVLFTNRYTIHDTKFETHIIIHKKLIKTNLDELDLPMICFYQDFSDDESNNKELKPIEINEQLIHNLQYLMKNSHFKKIMNQTYKI